MHVEVHSVSWQAIPSAAHNRLFVDYVTGQGEARSFFTHTPLAFEEALVARQQHSYPRQALAHIVRRYNAMLGAHPRALANCEAFASKGAFCVITGQQVGFLGGPVYTLYKIITAIRLAERLERELGERVVPVFWLATEDHDFGEINHADYQRRSGEVARISFGWSEAGRPIADLPVNDEVRYAYEAYFEAIAHLPHADVLKSVCVPRAEEDFCTWHARLWVQLFSPRGLLLVEPSILRPLAGPFFGQTLCQQGKIRRCMRDVARRLEEAGYVPPLNTERAGTLFTFDAAGRRVRVVDPPKHLARAKEAPHLYSGDVALRPLLADALLPVVVDVLGPGEIAYHAMLRPLYELFNLPQPLLFPRRSYTVLGQREATRLACYHTDAVAVLTGQADDVEALLKALIPVEDRERFAAARAGIVEALMPLRPYLESLTPSLVRTWEQVRFRALDGLAKLEERAAKARLSRQRLSRKELVALRNWLLPRGQLQERVYPFPLLFARYSSSLLDHLFTAGTLEDFSHHLLILEE